MKKAIIKLTTVFGLSCLLIACGGGGGGGSGNGGNNAPPPVQPIQPAPPAPQQPDAAPNIPAPLKNQAPDTGAEGGTKPQKSLENDNMAMSPPPSIQEKWEGACEAKSFCTAQNENRNHVTVYGYRMRADTNNNGRHYDFIYTINKEFENSNILSNFSAHYYKDGGFIYSPLKVSENSENKLIKVGDVDLVYNKGKISGNIYDGTEGADKTNPIFTITGSGNNIILESTKNMSIITPREKGVITAHFIDSAKSANDYKYLLGSGQSYPGGNNIGWVGVLFAE
ncbi:hypothetical protein [Pasteurella multocida]|uniref:hypothetical protein n=1 Tax=Pasteurella multocida TaxID=747 RepID=UPI0008FA5A39|nr:hypothetical protein [Pasteurella multocida]MDC4235501.1 hypothetical protein [Pasteurella multocida]OIQ13819.1 hypothetical protein UR07_08105 [Pasteurella multocida subsp. multocida]PNW22976.1 hypothetical protein AP056_08555 [Pasteurella multocida subsp. multocida]